MRHALGELLRPQLMRILVVVLLVANLVLVGGRVAFGGDQEGGNPPPGTFPNQGFHLGCADKNNGSVRIFITQHSAYGTNAPHDACTPGEDPIAIYIMHQ